MDQNMKKKGKLVSVCMSITISLFLSLFGTLTSGHFTVPGFIVSFIASLALSLIIGFLIPVKPLGDKLTAKMGITKPIPKLLIEVLLSDLIYTIPITIAMVAIATSKAPVPFMTVLPKSLISCLIFAYFVILIFQPLFIKLIIKPPKQMGPPSEGNAKPE